ncbi:transposase [Rubritalea marina]|uniref:transposase n=1 Tax=Rubritalea marina TaxID=361055 RepID=UPI000A014063|nr:transposase [Rubritalea marina]
MRIPRKYLLSCHQDTQGGIYHCVTRAVWREFVFDDHGREFFVQLMRKYEAFGDLKVLAYCIMSNHIHVMVYVPPGKADEISDHQFLKQLSHLYSQDLIDDMQQRLATARAIPDVEKRDAAVRGIREPYTRRMWNLSEFMRSIKQGYSRWFNKEQGKEGALWQGRFTSVQVQGGWHARFIAAYIDLNPLRAGIVKEPLDFRWCGYAAAHGSSKGVQTGLLALMLHESSFELCEAWKAVGREKMHEYLASLRQAEHDKKGSLKEERRFDFRSESARYRCMLAEEGEAAVGDAIPSESQSARRKRKLGFDRKEVEQILNEGGKLNWRQMLRCKLRFAVDGVIFGSKEFVEDGFSALQDQCGEAYANRTHGAKKMPYTKESRIYAHRQHLKDACEVRPHT